jgi:hypothetical protein
MADIKAIKDLALHAAKKTVPVEFASQTVADVNDALRAELRELCGTYNLFRRNKLDLFEIMQETMDEVVPAQVAAVVAQFAEIKQYANGVKTQFKVKKGKLRARKFATRATASGVYETFRLDTDVIEVPTFTIGDAAYIDFERFLNGDEDWADYMEALMDGILNKIYEEIYAELISAANKLQDNNHVGAIGGSSNTAFEIDDLASMIKVVKAYGDPMVVATADYISAMGDAVVESTGAADADKNEIREYGRLLKFRGTPVIELPVSYKDETNAEEVFGGAYAFIFPTNGEKVVKVAFEGPTIVKDWENRDNSMEIQAYKKMGTAIVTGNNWAIHAIKVD